MKSSPKIKFKSTRPGFTLIQVLGLLYRLKVLREDKMRMTDEYPLTAIRAFYERQNKRMPINHDQF